MVFYFFSESGDSSFEDMDLLTYKLLVISMSFAFSEVQFLFSKTRMMLS